MPDPASVKGSGYNFFLVAAEEAAAQQLRRVMGSWNVALI
jgi:hypothetical protein